MPNSAGDQGAVCTIASIGGIVIAPFGGGPFQTASVYQVVQDGLVNGAGKLQQTNPNAQAIDYWSGASDCGTSATGRGGNYYLQVGAQSTSGGNGSFIFLDPTGAQIQSMDSTGKMLATGTSNGVYYAVGNTATTGIGYNAGNPYFAKGGSVGMAQYQNSSMNFTAISLAAGDPSGTTADVSFNSTGKGVIQFFATQTASGIGASPAYPKGAAGTVTGTTNNLALDASAFQKLTGSATPVLTGIAPPTGGAHVDGNIRFIFNAGATAIQLNHNDASSTAANRLFMSTGANITLAQNQSVRITYDSTDNGSGAAGWRCTAAS